MFITKLEDVDAQVELQKNLFYRAMKMHILGNIQEGNSFRLKHLLETAPKDYTNYFEGYRVDKLPEGMHSMNGFKNVNAGRPLYCVHIYSLWLGDIQEINLSEHILNMNIAEFDIWFADQLRFRIEATKFKDLDDK